MPDRDVKLRLSCTTDPLVGKLKKAIDLSFIYPLVKDLYSLYGAGSIVPDCGVFHKGEHKKVFAYATNVACDKNNYILDFEVTVGNLHVSVVLPQLYEKLNKKYENIHNVVLDAGYKASAIAKRIIDDGKTPIMPYKRPMTKKGFFKNTNTHMMNTPIAISARTMKYLNIQLQTAKVTKNIRATRKNAKTFHI